MALWEFVLRSFWLFTSLWNFFYHFFFKNIFIQKLNCFPNYYYMEICIIYNDYENIPTVKLDIPSFFFNHQRNFIFSVFIVHSLDSSYVFIPGTRTQNKSSILHLIRSILQCGNMAITRGLCLINESNYSRVVWRKLLVSPLIRSYHGQTER